MKRYSVLYLTFLFLSIMCYGQQSSKYKKYIVRKKATVETVAFLNGVTPEQILLANPTFQLSTKLYPGTAVNIPCTSDEKDDVPVENDEIKDETPENADEPVAKVDSSSTPSAEVPVPPKEIEKETVVAENNEQPEPVVPPKEYVPGENKISFNSKQKTISIAAILPFENSSLAQSMAELYSGMVIAASDLSDNNDYTYNLKAYSSENLSDDFLDDILSSCDVIVGPVHKDNFIKVASWAKEHHKPIVSPLSAFDVENNDYVICMPPSESEKTEPLTHYLSAEKNIILIEHSLYTNKDLLAEFKKVAPGAKKFKYVREAVTPQNLSALMDPSKDNVVLVPTEQQGAIEDILSKITAVNSPVKTFNISIVGSSKWLNLSNFSQTLLFRGNVLCLSSYFFDRKDRVVSTLFEDYIKAYERIPGRFAMRGYDIVDIIGNSLQQWGDEMLLKMDEEEFVPLQTPYYFMKNEKNGNIQNVKWMLVSYTEDYSISFR